MNALARKVADRFRSMGVLGLARFSEQKPINGHSQEMTGLFASLSEKQKADALSYRGNESHGDVAFVRK